MTMFGFNKNIWAKQPVKKEEVVAAEKPTMWHGGTFADTVAAWRDESERGPIHDKDSYHAGWTASWLAYKKWFEAQAK